MERPKFSAIRAFSLQQRPRDPDIGREWRSGVKPDEPGDDPPSSSQHDEPAGCDDPKGKGEIEATSSSAPRDDKAGDLKSRNGDGREETGDDAGQQLPSSADDPEPTPERKSTSSGDAGGKNSKPYRPSSGNACQVSEPGLLEFQEQRNVNSVEIKNPGNDGSVE